MLISDLEAFEVVMPQPCQAAACCRVHRFIAANCVRVNSYLFLDEGYQGS
jgi:hypothetical protein